MTGDSVETTAPTSENPPQSEAEPRKKRKPLPPNLFARLVIALVGMVWLGLGITTFTNLDMVAGWVDYGVSADLARFEFRAEYGGLSIALAALHFFGGLRAKWLGPSLAMAMTLLVGLVTGRILSLVADGYPGMKGLTLLLSEIVMIALIVFAMVRLRSSDRD